MASQSNFAVISQQPTSDRGTALGNNTQPEEPAMDIEAMKKRRTALRRKITLTCGDIERAILTRGSRGGIQQLLAAANNLLDEAGRVNDLLLEDDTTTDFDQQHQAHNRYLVQLGKITEEVDKYLLERADDPASIAPPQPDPDTNRLEEGRRQSIVSAQQRADSARAELLAADEALRQLQIRNDDQEPDPDPSRDAVARWCQQQSRLSALPPRREEETPDDWIDLYQAGLLPPCSWSGTGTRSSVKADLEGFSGKALDWFCWIDLFRALVHDTSKSPGEKLAILKRSLRGDCLDIVYGLGGGEAAYIEALSRLKAAYGRRDVMRAAHSQALDKMEFNKADPSSFKRFAEKVRTHLFDLSRIGESATTDIIERLCLKLSLNDRVAWNADKPPGLEHRTLNQFGTWLCNRASAYQNAHSLAAEQSGGSNQKQRQQARSHQTSSTVNTSQQKKTTRRPYCFKCEGEHWLQGCASFKGLAVGERVSFCVKHRLCFSCFGTRHSSRDCSRRKICQTAGCNRNHHPLLHEPVSNPEESQENREGRVYAARTEPLRIAFGVIQLHVVSEDGTSVAANVMYDEGSDTTLVREGLANQLKMASDGQVNLALEGAAAVHSIHQSRRVRFQLRSESGELLQLQGATLPTVTRPVPVIQWGLLKERWPYLRDLPLRSSGGRIDILLGLDQGHLMGVLEARNGREGEPIASKTRLGWIARGVVDNDTRSISARVHHVFSSTHEEDQVAKQLRRFCDTENFGTEHQSSALSIDDQRAVKILVEGVRQLPVGYEVPITWKEGEPDLPSNRPLAERRFNGLLRRFAQNPDYEKDYQAAMEKYFEKDYAVFVDQPSLGMPEYFLAHHGVYKGTKLRVVFDAAAPYRGKSLNDSILSGPALQTPLASVITKFREGEIAWAADIEAMFSRIRLRASDSRYFRFLWKRKGEEVAAVCEMRRLPFGATCSPFIAIHTTRRTPVDFKAEPDAAFAIANKMYVDDYLSSAKNLELAIKEATGVNRTLAMGDLHLQGWISNSSKFLASIAPDRVAATRRIGLSLDSEDGEKVLGLYWQPSSDNLSISVDKMENVNFTRVNLLSKVASIFDPLGIVSPLTVKAKIRLRELALKGIKWEEEVVDQDRGWWEEWFRHLAQLNIHIPRCLFPEEDQIKTIELHTFGDASEEAYAAVSFIRNEYEDGQIRVRQVRAATKLAPKKTISVPKLELNASLLAARLATSVQEALTMKIHRRVFWTDSSTVRNWIRATAASYQTFVSNRIGEIQTLTEPTEWRFIPGKLNPADSATRSLLEEEVFPKRWINGPEFLLSDEDNWPQDVPWMVVQEEIRPCRVNQTTALPTFDWEKVEIRSEDVHSLAKLEEPLLQLVRRCQAEVYEEELRRLKKGEVLHLTSSLLALRPVLGEDGVLRLGGRAGRARMPYDHLHPPLLPGKHPLTVKIITAFHQQLNHIGTDYLLTYIRQHFWITHGREAVKKIKRGCLVCRREGAKPGEQLMGELPDSRLDYGSPPFSRTACDLFGPLEVGFARNRTAKRWGVLFTCLVTRAVFLDLVPTLSADDFLLVFRRFVGLYGKPKKLHSDNGTNFVGAEAELREEAEKLYSADTVADYFNKKGVEWTFQPPRTPHFGGAHESLVRSTKRALYRALEQERGSLRLPTEDMLRTLLFEVAGLLNSRPLTSISSDPDDYRPLTPNDFLNRPVTADPPEGTYNDALPREHYRYVQRMANLFWDLWKTVYLQSLQARKKWKVPRPNFSVGDVVLEIDRNCKRGQWKIGRITNVFPGSDGLVRAVDVKLETGTYRRGINQICLLDHCSTVLPVPVRPASGEDVTAKSDQVKL